MLFRSGRKEADLGGEKEKPTNLRDSGPLLEVLVEVFVAILMSQSAGRRKFSQERWFKEDERGAGKERNSAI